MNIKASATISQKAQKALIETISEFLRKKGISPEGKTFNVSSIISYSINTKRQVKIKGNRGPTSLNCTVVTPEISVQGFMTLPQADVSRLCQHLAQANMAAKKAAKTRPTKKQLPRKQAAVHHYARPVHRPYKEPAPATIDKAAMQKSIERQQRLIADATRMHTILVQHRNTADKSRVRLHDILARTREQKRRDSLNGQIDFLTEQISTFNREVEKQVSLLSRLEAALLTMMQALQ